MVFNLYECVFNKRPPFFSQHELGNKFCTLFGILMKEEVSRQRGYINHEIPYKKAHCTDIFKITTKMSKHFQKAHLKQMLLLPLL